MNTAVPHTPKINEVKENSHYKSKTWYLRNVKKQIPAIQYHDGVDAAVIIAGI
jgi:hypothetical protein